MSYRDKVRPILITGAAGLLGSSLVPYLRMLEHRVITQARSAKADFRIDLCDRDRTWEMLTCVQPSLIINLVGLTNVDLCEDQVNDAFLANTATVESMVSWMELGRGDCHLIHISTDQVYDNKGPHTENQINIRNNYALSKYAGELVAARVSSTILRTNFVGRSMVSHRSSFTDWVYNSLTSKEAVQVLDDVYFSPLSITTLVQKIESVIQLKPRGIYNLGSHNGMSKADFVFAFAECLGLATSGITRIHADQAKFLKAYRPRDMRMDSAKFENTLGVRLPKLRDLIQPLAKEYDDDTRFHS